MSSSAGRPCRAAGVRRGVAAISPRADRAALAVQRQVDDCRGAARGGPGRRLGPAYPAGATTAGRPAGRQRVGDLGPPAGDVERGRGRWRRPSRVRRSVRSASPRSASGRRSGGYATRRPRRRRPGAAPAEAGAPSSTASPGSIAATVKSARARQPDRVARAAGNAAPSAVGAGRLGPSTLRTSGRPVRRRAPPKTWAASSPAGTASTYSSRATSPREPRRTATRPPARAGISIATDPRRSGYDGVTRADRVRHVRRA